MIVVHGFVATSGRLALWAETTMVDSSATGQHAAAGGKAGPHPFAVTPPFEGPVGTETLRLPAVGRTPVASPELGVAPRDRGGSRALPFQVPVVLLPAGADPESLVEAAGERAGSSIGHLADVVAFAVDLVNRGRMLPGVVDGATGAEARWAAVLGGADLARFEELQRSMPGVALAGGVWSAERALRAVLDAQVDGLVRIRLGEPLLPVRRSSDVPSGRGAVHAWLDALTGPQATIDIATTGLAALRDTLDRWRASGAADAVRTCFRLHHIDTDADIDGDTDAVSDADGGEDQRRWRLEFLLQPVADPSVLVPARDVWAGRASMLFRWVEHPPELLLRDLGRASRLWPELDEALHEERPVQLLLDTAGAYRFLTHAQVLTDAGYGVLLPAWWQRRPELGLTLTVHSADTTTPVLRDQTANLDAIVDYRWGLALGTQYLSEADLIELAAAKVPLVRLRGRWVYLDRKRLEAGLAFLSRGGSGQLTAGEALRLVRLAPDSVRPLPLTTVDGTGWLADLLSGRAGEQLELLHPPVSLSATLRPYQRKGLSWLAFLDRLGVGALLADDMGLGKTVQVLALEALLRERGPRPPTLIVCPLSVLGNWKREIERFTPTLRAHIHHGAGRGELGDYHLVLTTYQVATRDVELLSRTSWDRIVLDEAQHIKNSATATAQAVRRLPTRHRVALTGTPVENRLGDLWSIMDFLNPGLLGPAGQFRARYSVPVERFANTDAAARLRTVTRPFVLRRLKTDTGVIADLPEKLERIQWCNLTIEQATLYRAVVNELFAKLREGRTGTKRKGLILAAMTKLKQVCNHPAHLLGDGSPIPGRSGKIDRLEEILANALADGDRVLAFTQFARLGAMLVPHLRARLGTEVSFLHGGTAKTARDAMIERFQTETGPAVLLLSVKAGGTGLNLTAANHVIHIDRWWNPATEAQATDRAYRIGQRRDVQVHTFVCLGTIEERIHQMVGEKRYLAQVAVGAGESWLTGLSTRDLLDLVELGPEAVGE